MPRGHGNVDHLAVAPSGVYVIDAKAVKGKARISRPTFGKPKLTIDGRNRTKLVNGLDRQVTAVRHALDEAGHGDVPVSGIFCFTKADLPLLGTLEIGGYRLLYCRATARKLNRSGPYERDAIQRIACELATAFPRA